MSGISGWVGYHADQAEVKNLAQAMSSPMTCFDDSNVSVVLGKASALCSAGQDMHQSGVCRKQGIMAAIQGIYRWDSPDLARISKEEGPGSALLEGYRSLGERVLDRIKGRFSIAVTIEDEGEAFFATDRTGSESLIYVLSGDSIVFASKHESLKVHPACDVDIDPQAIFNYLYFHVVPSPGSIYRGWKKLLPGTYALFRNGELMLSSYWDIEYQENPTKRSFGELKEEFIATLQSSIRDAYGGAKTGAFLSGGTDSSTVTGMLSGILEDAVPTYSIGFSEERYDEMEYARIAVKHFHAEHHEYYVTPEDIVDAVPGIAEIYGEPFGNSSAVPAYYCAKMAKEDGVIRMLAGDGGDELFAGNCHYARQYLFSAYDTLPQFVRRSLIEPVVMSSAFPGGAPLLNKLRRYVEQAMVPMPERLETYNLLKTLGIQNVMEPDFMGLVDVSSPEALMSEHYYNTSAQTILNRMLWYDYKFVLADKDLPKVSRMCELAGVEVAFPLLSEEMIKFAAKVPTKLKLKGQNLRYFFKESLKDFLPPEILSKEKHGFGLPIGLWVKNHKGLRELALDNLNDLKSRNIVRSRFIDDLMDYRLEEHAPYYGTMVWVLLMLEQWFKRHHP